MAGSRRVQTAERVHYYFTRKCVDKRLERGVVSGVRERERGKGDGGKRYGDTHVYGG